MGRAAAGTTEVEVRGARYRLDDSWRDNLELEEDLYAMDHGDLGAVGRVLKWIFGEEQAEAIRESLRNDKGVIPRSEVERWLVEFIEATGSKN